MQDDPTTDEEAITLEQVAEQLERLGWRKRHQIATVADEFRATLRELDAIVGAGKRCMLHNDAQGLFEVAVRFREVQNRGRDLGEALDDIIDAVGGA